MIEIREFERYVLPFMDNVPTVAVDDAIRDAAIEFCERTRVLRQVLEGIDAGTELETSIPHSAQEVTIGEVMAVWFQGRQLAARGAPELNELYPQGWRALVGADARDVEAFYCRRPGLIQLVPGLSVAYPAALTVEVVFKPVREAVQVDDILFNEYAEVIANGAMARLHAHATQEYADPSRVGTYTALFEDAIQAYSDRSQRGYQHTILRSGHSDCFI